LFYLRIFNKHEVYCEINEVRITNSDAKKYFGIKKLFYSWEEKLSKYYTGLICISKHIQDYYFPYNSNTIIIPILSKKGDINLSSTHNYNKVIGEKFKLIFTGSVSIEKENLLEFLKGLALIKDKSFVFHIIGNCPLQEHY